MLELEGLRKRYGDRVALDGVTFTVRPGELYGFVGTNGAGKTTTMRITLGVLEPDAGTVRYQGKPVDSATRRTFGYMPEERGLYPKMRVGDQLRYLAELHGLSRGDADKAATYWMERLSVIERAGDRVEALSLGNQQRVQLAAALVHHPAVLVLDEPFSGLDPVGVDNLAEVLRERAAEGVPVVFSSHQLELVERLCDSIGIIYRGRMVATGTVDELRASRAERVLRVGTDVAAGWADRVPGVVSADYGKSTTLVLAADADDQAVLDAARALGPVREFTPLRASLAELFREAVADHDGDEDGSNQDAADPRGADA
ncbi:MAG: ATP-binding cassette domain-containing protein [Catenulisporales bacterium]|jgi:ABC-2 type transport system ATP-binding protein|nr:ATP-binding cassette domain-containing protein [Catenulisporales bacterium]